jgi:hypothetical protein
MRILLVVAVLFMFILPVSVSAQLQFVPVGYSYFTSPEGVGTVTTVVGFLDPPAGFTYPFSVDFTNNEYTFYFQTTITSIVPLVVTTEYHYANTTFYIYEDPSKNGTYGTNPPNGTAPSTFQDGTLILSGDFKDIVRLDYNFGFPEPTAIGSIDFTGGTKLGELIQINWNFHAGISSTVSGIPSGYKRNWSCKLVPGTVPVEETTWGNIKNLYAVE